MVFSTRTSMLTSFTVLLSVAYFQGSSVEAGSSLRGERQNEPRRLSVSGHCNSKNKVPSTYETLISEWGVVNPSSSLAEALECGPSRTIQEVEWVSNPTGICGSHFEFEVEMEGCCGGVTDENERIIDAKINLKDSRPINKVVFKLESVVEPRDCCATCSCFGDPHCSPFESEAHNAVKSFLACDTAKILEDGDCTSRVDTDAGAKRRCLGEAEGYEHNGEGRCQWLPDTGTYDQFTDGGPCQPTTDVAMHVIGREFTAVPVATAGTETSSASTNPPRWDVRVLVGDRGISRKVLFRMDDDGTGNPHELTLDVKSDCSYLRDNNEAMAAASGDAVHALFDNPTFSVTRQLISQVTAQGTTLDLLWKISNKKSSETMTFNCLGATAPLTRTDGVESFIDQVNSLGIDQKAQLGLPIAAASSTIWSSDPDIATEVGSQAAASKSTRVAKQTIIDASFTISKVGMNSAGDEGYCFNGYFEEYRAENWYNGENSPLEQCTVQPNLSYEDRILLASLPICQEFLAENNCDTFQDTVDANGNRSQPHLRYFNRYKNVLDNCIKAYCGSVPDSDTNSREQCYAKFYDFGSKTAIAEHPTDSDASKPNMVQEDCEPYLRVVYITDTSTRTVDWDGTSDIEFDGAEVPRQVLVEQHDCAGICGTRPNLKLKASMSTDCGELDDSEYVCYKRDEVCVETAGICPP